MRDTAIALSGVVKRYPRFTLDAVDLTVPAGTILGLIGPNGAGKSTLLRIMMGLVRADAGRVVILGRPMPEDETRIKARVGFVSEDMALYGGASLRWHMDFVRAVYPGWDDLAASDLLRRLQLDPAQRVRGMSRGQQVKSLLLLALARHAEVLVLDEPTAGLDPLVRHEVIALLAVAREAGTTIVFSSHHGEDVAQLADDVAFVHGGRIIAHAPVGAIMGGGHSLEAAFLDRVGALSGGRAA